MTSANEIICGKNRKEEKKENNINLYKIKLVYLTALTFRKTKRIRN